MIPLPGHWLDLDTGARCDAMGPGSTLYSILDSHDHHPRGRQTDKPENHRGGGVLKPRTPDRNGIHGVGILGKKRPIHNAEEISQREGKRARKSERATGDELERERGCVGTHWGTICWLREAPLNVEGYYASWLHGAASDWLDPACERDTTHGRFVLRLACRQWWEETTDCQHAAVERRCLASEIPDANAHVQRGHGMAQSHGYKNAH